MVLAPPANGTRIRVLDIPPDSDDLMNKTEVEIRAHFAGIGAASAPSRKSNAPARHAYMHRTETIDYGIVLSGEIVLVISRKSCARNRI